MIYTSHNMDEVEMMCDRVIFISRGRIVMEGDPKQIAAQANMASLEELFIAIARNGNLYQTSRNQEAPGCGCERAASCASTTCTGAPSPGS
jgi:ABC-type multidrug transport system ATPase subunit